MSQCRAPANEQEFAQYYHLRWQVLRAPWQQPQDSEKDELEDQSFHRAIYDINQNLLAVGRLHFVDQHLAQVRYVAVDENYQGQGLGKKIMSALETLALEHGATKIKLNAREVAVDFYQSLGYQSQGFSHLLYDEISHYAMSKVLAHQQNEHSKLAEKLQTTWHETIALSKAMNIEVASFDGDNIVVGCDHLFNKNLHQTMFAGSIYTLATLTGWGWVYCQLEQRGLVGDIVLADANIRYKKPLKGVAQASTSGLNAVESFSTAAEKGKAKIELQIDVRCGDEVVAAFTGLYFAIMNK